MPRYYQMKGGIWKNTEDEILKAAVMKYGINQWARISSLLVRKSPRDCKSRWYEWLDPSIKKTEWGRDEEEKLLHMVKLFPCQWRTIASAVGRTAAQCLEHYEKLLDQALTKSNDGVPLYDPLDDPRRLKPGEIDPAPETKPARPDPIDMDEDEKEMLQEARARLANTKGKKAKRKAREKQLEEARRLAALQKRRELRAAGVLSRQSKKKIEGIDYNNEIPFYKKAPKGFFEVEDQGYKAPEINLKRPIRLDKLEGKSREEKEAQQRKKDLEKKRKRELENMPAVISQSSKQNDPEQIRVKSKLNLPTPQISDQELEEIVRLSRSSSSSSSSSAMIEDATGQEEYEGPTKALLSSFRSTPSLDSILRSEPSGANTPGRVLLTPLGQQQLASRTPARTPTRPDNLMIEAQYLAALNSSNIIEGELPEQPETLKNDQESNTQVVSTPNPLKSLVTPSGPLATITQAPLRKGAGVLPVMVATPIRDLLKINDSQAFSDRAALSEEDFRKRESIKRLKAELLSLPKPSKEYQIDFSALLGPDRMDDHDSNDKDNADDEVDKREDDDDEDDEDDDNDERKKRRLFVEDASERDARKKREQQRVEEAEFKKRSTVFQRNLPQPQIESLDASILLSGAKRGDDGDDHPESLVLKEMLKIIVHDAAYQQKKQVPPPLGEKDEEYAKRSNRIRQLLDSVGSQDFEACSEREIGQANELINKELADCNIDLSPASLDSKIEKDFEESRQELLYVPSLNRFVSRQKVNGSPVHKQALSETHQLLVQQMHQDSEKIKKIDSKVGIYHRGYEARASRLETEVKNVHAEIAENEMQLACFLRIKDQEDRGLESRTGDTLERVSTQRQKERSLQNRFASLKSTLETLKLQHL